MIETLTAVPARDGVTRAMFEAEIVPAGRPVVLRGLVADWPALGAAASDEALATYLVARGGPAPVKAWLADPEIGGRFNYSADLAGFNHQRGELPLAKLLDLLLAMRDEADAPGVYAGGVPIAAHLPGLLPELGMPLLDPARERLVSAWIGNQTRAPAHWDLPQNLACVVAGRRRFTLFPPEQVANLYVGPLEMTLAGQPSSLVDLDRPDVERFPKLREALAAAEVAELGPGDALYVPTLAGHSVEGLAPVNGMVNFWWRDGAAAERVTPLFTLFHALVTLRDLPAPERAAWRAMFDHYVFAGAGPATAHLPVSAHGLLGPMTPENERRIAALLVDALRS